MTKIVTKAERIHILGYSAGTRVVLNTLSQLSFIHKNDDKVEIRRRCRIGRIILVGSDYDRQLFGALLAEGMLKIPETMTIYMSHKDKALNISRWLFRRDRLGQIDRLALNPIVVQYLNNTPQLILIDDGRRGSGRRCPSAGGGPQGRGGARRRGRANRNERALSLCGGRQNPSPRKRSPADRGHFASSCSSRLLS